MATTTVDLGSVIGPKGDPGLSAVPNLLLNSDFSNPVNQRGATSYVGALSYSIDLWKLQYETNLDIENGFITLSGKYDIRQLNTVPIQSGTTLTIAARINVLTAPQGIKLATLGGELITRLQQTGWQTICVTCTADQDYAVGAGNLAFLGLQNSSQSIQVAWIAVYEGSYTADTLPAYVPRGYGAELTECQRYFVRFDGPTEGNPLHTFIGASNGSLFFMPLRLPMPLRKNVTPTITYSDVNLYPYKAGTAVTVASVAIENMSPDHQTLALRIGHDTDALMTDGRVCTLRIKTGGYFDVSADL